MTYNDGFKKKATSFFSKGNPSYFFAYKRKAIKAFSDWTVYPVNPLNDAEFYSKKSAMPPSGAVNDQISPRN